jgi:hypothetical protein
MNRWAATDHRSMNGWAATDYRSIGILSSAGTTCSLSDAELPERFLSRLNDVSE